MAFAPPSLRRTLITSAVIVVVAATAASLFSLYLTLETRNAIDRDSNALIDEQRIADRIVGFTHRQQIDAYRILQQPDNRDHGSFDVNGDSAEMQMQLYLFRELSPAARLQVERMKETHQAFEVSAHRALDLV
ncbi:MAG: hypothetical protein ABIY52_06985 [Gemmatimonadaceae bacterium]